MIYPENFEEKTGFNIIKQKIRSRCLSETGKIKIDNLKFLTRYDLIKRYSEQVAEMKDICEDHEDFPIDNYFDVQEFIEKIKVDGAYLTVDEVFKLYKSLITIKNIVRFFSGKEENLFPRLMELAKNVKVFPYIYESIERILNKQGKVKDNASPELQRIKRTINEKNSTVSKQLNRILKSVKDLGLTDKDAGASVRDGRMVIPIQAANKRKLSGIIHDESATGKTVFIEPAEVVELNNEIKELELAERREVIKILIEFTTSIRPYFDDIEKSSEFLGIIDAIRAKALFSITINANKVKCQSTPEMSWLKARHPLLYLSFIENKKEVVPLNIDLNNENRILLISGPNAGGKSVCLKTVGILQYMFQCGLLIPADENSKFGIFDDIFIDIGDEQSIENDLSTYSSHLLNMKHFTKNAREKSLVLIDEFGVGTEPMLGGAIAESILEYINNNKAFGVITTHYTNLKHFASSTAGIINGAMLYDNNKMQPLFQLEIGKPGSSFAFEIASKIGLTNEIIDNSKNKIGEEHVYFDKHLREIARDKRYWENKRQKIRKGEKRLEELLYTQEQELNKLKKERKEIIEKAKMEAENLLRNSNKEIEKTIRIIKEAQAEKEKTKNARKEFESFKEKAIVKNDPEQERIEKKIKKLKQKELELKKRNPELIEKTEIKPEPEKDTSLHIGNKIKITGQEVYGEIIDIGEKSVVTAFGNMITTIDKSKVEKVSNNEYKKKAKVKTSSNFNALDIAKRKMNFQSGLDIRGKRADEAIQLVTEFIDEAILVEAHEVKILHGKGNGILRQIIRDYLRTVDIVESANDAHIELGGAGITIVKLAL